MSFPRYPKYKPSGVEWLGDVPEGWVLIQGRRQFTQEREAARSTDDQLSATQKYGVVPQKLFMEMEDQKVSLALSGLDNFKHVEKDDFVISLRSFQGGIERSKYSGCVSPAYTVLRSVKPIDACFWGYLLKSKGYIEALQTMTDGIRDGKNISYQQFGQIRVPVLPLPEQTQIATFLDRETAKIDALVAEQRRLMELLKEKRQAVISHAVTKGLNPQAPMKPSGIEWLGDVPAHWEVKPLKYSITKIEQGWSPQCGSEPAAENEWGVLKVGCGNRDQFDPNEQKVLPLDVEPPLHYEIKSGDILVSRGNSLELVGSATFVEKVRPRLLLCDLLYRFRAKPDRAESEFLVLSLRSPNVRFQIERDATGTSASMKKIGQGIIRAFIIALPPRDEQLAIIKSIKLETASLDTLTAEAQRAIDLLQERRTALISAAVTGQIDVRGILTS